jgi:hypothetical protein
LLIHLAPTLPRPDIRNMTRSDALYFEWLVGNGFVASAGGDLYELTEKGKAAAELGFYEV